MAPRDPRGRTRSGFHVAPGHSRHPAGGILLALLVVAVPACADPSERGPGAETTIGEDLPPREAFWNNLRQQCGSAYSGGLTLEPPGDEMLTGTEELIVHFRECEENELRLPFHIEIEDAGEWDRSRTWVFFRHEDSLELRHDHRLPDGSPDEGNTWYGATSTGEGTANRQEFLSAERTEESGYERGWRVEIVPGERYTYGTTRRGEWSWRVDFDLSQPIPPPPPPWGHD